MARIHSCHLIRVKCAKLEDHNKMDILSIKEELTKLNSDLYPNQKKYISFRSVRNFVFHFEELKSQGSKDIVVELLTEYLKVIKEKDYYFDRPAGFDLGIRFLRPISQIYVTDVRFIRRMSTSGTFITGVMVDSLLLIAGVLRNLDYIPITLVVLCSWRIYQIKLEKKFKVYGLFY